jgi:hypothetical protein
MFRWQPLPLLCSSSKPNFASLRALPALQTELCTSASNRYVARIGESGCCIKVCMRYDSRRTHAAHLAPFGCHAWPVLMCRQAAVLVSGCWSHKKCNWLQLNEHRHSLDTTLAIG